MKEERQKEGTEERKKGAIKNDRIWKKAHM
jgi:hypothetical protein